MKSKQFPGHWIVLIISCFMILFGIPGIILAQAPDAPLIRLQYAVFDPALGEPLIDAAQRSPDQVTSKTTYLIQFTGAVRSEWKAALEALGIRLHSYIPDYAFIARGDIAAIEQARNLPFTRWIGLYHPAYRLSSSLWATNPTGKSGENAGGDATLHIQTFPDVDMENLVAMIQSWGGSVETQSVNSSDGYLRVNLPLERVNDLAAYEGMLWIEPYYAPQLHNDIGSGVIKVPQVRSNLGLYGNGQVVAVSDTGLDTGNLSTLHPDVRGRVIGTECLGRTSPCDWSDYVAHGTHVAGSVLGNGATSGSKPATHQYANSYAGSAPEARLYFQSLAGPLGGLSGIPADEGDLMRSAYTHGARIHTNSWGGTSGGQDNPYGGYVITSRQVDQAMWENKDQLVLFSAGNNGKDTNKDGVIEPDSIGQPGTAKNVLTVGASENNRPTILNIWGSSYGAPISSDKRADKTSGLAAFSSRGPTDDGRIKPDVVAPGTYIASMRSSQILFEDDMEGDVSNYATAMTGGGTGDSWLLLTDAAHKIGRASCRERV